MIKPVEKHLATTETENFWDSSMCPNFNLNRSISSETILKQGFNGVVLF